MKKLLIYLTMAGIINMTGCRDKIKLLRSTSLPDFPSGSSMEIDDNTIILIGDDATQVLFLDTNYNRRDSVSISTEVERRIPKDRKHDYEASAILQDGVIAVFGSGSSDRRNNALFIRLPFSKKDSLQLHNLTPLYQAFRERGINDLNIEGAALVNDQLVLANRANESFPHNHLLTVAADSLLAAHPQPFLCKLLLPGAQHVIGLSGLSYLAEKDVLLFTASTELTGSSYDDGAIGDSYIGWIKNAREALKKEVVTVHTLLNISQSYPALKNQKIESIAVETAKGTEVIAHLVADNDDGATTLFKVSFSIEED